MIKKIVLLPDIHYPNHNPEAMEAVFKFVKWFKPHAVNLLGDAMEMEFANHWQKRAGNLQYFKNITVAGTYNDFDRDILSRLESVLPKNCEKVFMEGNHEYWTHGIVAKDPTLKGVVEPELFLRLALRGWEWIPYIQNHKRGIKQYGKLLATHGFYTNKYHAAKTAETFSKSVVYGHTHDIQSYTKVTVDDVGYHTAQSIGCLCTRSPEFMRGNMNRWVNAFGIVLLREDGMFNIYVLVIIDGKFSFDGKVFDGNK